MPVTAPCTQPVKIIKAVNPAYPRAAQDLQIGRTLVVVAVAVDALGKVQGARIVQSSSIGVLDEAAINAAKGSTYAPAEKDCAPAAGTYMFRVTFDPYS